MTLRSWSRQPATPDKPRLAELGQAAQQDLRQIVSRTYAADAQRVRAERARQYELQRQQQDDQDNSPAPSL